MRMLMKPGISPAPPLGTALQRHIILFLWPCALASAYLGLRATASSRALMFAWVYNYRYKMLYGLGHMLSGIFRALKNLYPMGNSFQSY